MSNRVRTEELCMDVLSQNEIDALLKKLLSDASVLPSEDTTSKSDSVQDSIYIKPCVNI